MHQYLKCKKVMTIFFSNYVPKIISLILFINMRDLDDPVVVLRK